MKIFENVVLLSAVQLFSLVLPLLWLPYLAITLGVDQIGRIAFALSICQLILMGSDYGFNLSGPKAIAIQRELPDKLAEIFISISIIRILIALIGLVSIIIISIFVEKIYDNLTLILITYVMVIGNVIYPQWFFQGLEQLRIISFVQILARFIILLCIFDTVKGPEDIYWAAFLQAGGYLIGGIIAIPLTLKALQNSNLVMPSVSNLKLQLKDGWHFFLSSAAINFYTTSNILMLGLITDPMIVGYYYIAEKVIRASIMIFSPLVSALYPHVSRLAMSDDYTKFRNFIKKIIVLFLFIGIILCIAVFNMAPWLINNLFGKEFSPSIPVLQAFALLPLPLAASSVLGTLIMFPYGMQKEVSCVVLAAALMNFFIFIPATYFYGAVGAAVANVAVETLVTLMLVGFFYKNAQKSSKFNYIS